MAVRFAGAGKVGPFLRLSLASDSTWLRPALRVASAAVRRAASLQPEDDFRFRVALGEALANAIGHGNRCDPERRVRVLAEAVAGGAVVTVADEGEGFEPEAVPDPTRGDGLTRSGGRGLALVRGLADEVIHAAGGRRVVLVFRAGSRSGGGAMRERPAARAVPPTGSH